MAYREVTRVDIQEIIRRWQAGEGYRRIAAGTSLSRNTVRKYLSVAKAEDITKDGSVPTDDQLSRLAVIGQSGPRQAETPSEDLLSPWADQIHRWLTGERLQLTRIHELLLGRGCPVSYQSLRRFVQKRNWRRSSKVTVRMEDTPPGEVVEVDFGRLGLIHDPETGRRRAVWALLLVLGYSRHCFVWPSFGQTLEDVIAGLESAWSFFGGIPKYLVIDNCPPAVATADPLNPNFTRGFLEYSQRRGFIADAARARHPKDKPKVERGVPYARERFFKGGEFRDLADVREQARRWCRDVAGLRIPRHHPQEAPGGVPGRGAPGPAPLGRRGLRDRRLAGGQGPPRPSHPVSPVSVLGAAQPVPTGPEGGGQGGQQAGAHLPPRPVDQDPPPSAQGWPRHRPRGLSGPPLRLHHQQPV